MRTTIKIPQTMPALKIPPTTSQLANNSEIVTIKNKSECFIGFVCITFTNSVPLCCTEY